MRKLIVWLIVSSLIASLIWLFVNPGWEPIVTSIGIVISLVTILYKANESHLPSKMIQKGGRKSTNIQGRGNINVKIK
jgi:hypothetical protein